MKTKLISYLIVLLGIATFLNAQANTNEILKVYFQSSNIINLIYTAHTKSSPTVFIYDSNKNLVFSETISNNYGVARQYNFSSMPEGEYLFEVIDGKLKTVQSLSYKKFWVNKPKNLKVDIVKESDGGKFNLKCFEVNRKLVIVKIFSKSGHLLYEDLIAAKEDFSRVYDLSKLKETQFVFEITSGDRVVSREVSLDNSQLSLSK